jgi:hypothetical protein
MRYPSLFGRVLKCDCMLVVPMSATGVTQQQARPEQPA